MLQGESAITPFFTIETSFGGIESRGVKLAVEAVQKAVNDGARYFVRTDIKEFFQGILKDAVIEKIAGAIPDRAFIELLRAAVTTELKNVVQLGKLSRLFPTDAVGVAQGCCLSPLFGNIVLEDFDKRMNGRGIVCLRYVDDLLLLGRAERHVIRAFDSAKTCLGRLGLQVHDPGESDKAERGKAGRDAISFLGCEIYANRVYPNKESRDRLLKKIRERLQASIEAMSNPRIVRKKKMSATETLSIVDSVLRAWGNGYGFCTHWGVFKDLDVKIEDLLNDYLEKYVVIERRFVKSGREDRRRVLGVHLLEDSITTKTGC